VCVCVCVCAGWAEGEEMLSGMPEEAVQYFREQFAGY
jgi:hypothetical protein